MNDLLKELAPISKHIDKYLGYNQTHKYPENPNNIPVYEAYRQSVKSKIDQTNSSPDRSLLNFIFDLIEHIRELEINLSSQMQRSKMYLDEIDQLENKLAQKTKGM